MKTLRRVSGTWLEYELDDSTVQYPKDVDQWTACQPPGECVGMCHLALSLPLSYLTVFINDMNENTAGMVLTADYILHKPPRDNCYNE